jgi:hypothetical protein
VDYWQQKIFMKDRSYSALEDTRKQQKWILFSSLFRKKWNCEGDFRIPVKLSWQVRGAHQVRSLTVAFSKRAFAIDVDPPSLTPSWRIHYPQPRIHRIGSTIAYSRTRILKGEQATTIPEESPGSALVYQSLQL